MASTASRASRSASAARSPRATACRSPVRSGGTHSATGNPAPTGASPPSSRSAVIARRRSPASRAAASAARWSSTAFPNSCSASRARPRATCDPPGQLGRLRPDRGVEGAGQQGHRVGGGGAAGPLAGEHPGPRGARPVADRGGVGRDGFRGGGEQVRSASMVGRPHRHRRGGVEDLLDQVVGELVAAPAVDQQPGVGGPCTAAQRLGRWDVQQPGDDGRIHRGAEHRARPQQLLQLRAGPGEPGEHRGLQRLRDARLRPAGATPRRRTACDRGCGRGCPRRGRRGPRRWRARRPPTGPAGPRRPGRSPRASAARASAPSSARTVATTSSRAGPGCRAR